MPSAVTYSEVSCATANPPAIFTPVVARQHQVLSEEEIQNQVVRVDRTGKPGAEHAPCRRAALSRHGVCWRTAESEPRMPRLPRAADQFLCSRQTSNAER